MSLALGGLTAMAVELALDGLSVRQSAIASNIANVNSAGYRPVKVSFEDQITDLIAHAQGKASSQVTIAGFQPRITHESPIQSLGGQNRLDINTVLLNQNVLQYQSLIKGINQYMSTIALATSDGRR
ncbi:flagellar basal body rod protein FlgB [Pseudomethylobacillus aquaticus]|nr:flagellar basal body protein [Pseudomethylobacillus aquaticus]